MIFNDGTPLKYSYWSVFFFFYFCDHAVVLGLPGSHLIGKGLSTLITARIVFSFLHIFVISIPASLNYKHVD